MISLSEPSSPNKPSVTCRTDGPRWRKTILISLLHMGLGGVCVKVTSRQRGQEWREVKKQVDVKDGMIKRQKRDEQERQILKNEDGNWTEKVCWNRNMQASHSETTHSSTHYLKYAEQSALNCPDDLLTAKVTNILSFFKNINENKHLDFFFFFKGLNVSSETHLQTLL